MKLVAKSHGEPPGGKDTPGPRTLDRIDFEMLQHVQADPTTPTTEIARRVGIATSTCWRRFHLLQEDGVIMGRRALVDGRRVGLTCEAYVEIKLSDCNQANLDAFETSVLTWPEVIDCAVVTGSIDYILRLLTPDIRSLDAFLRKRLQTLAYVAGVESRLVIRRTKDTSRLPLRACSPAALAPRARSAPPTIATGCRERSGPCAAAPLSSSCRCGAT